MPTGRSLRVAAKRPNVFYSTDIARFPPPRQPHDARRHPVPAHRHPAAGPSPGRPRPARSPSGSSCSWPTPGCSSSSSRPAGCWSRSSGRAWRPGPPIIGVFLAGIALGNAAGGRIADRNPSPRSLARFLALGAAAAVWMILFPRLLAATGWYTALPLGARIPVLALVACFPAGFVLSLLTPVAIKLGLPDVRRAGRAAGMVFATGTLGCLAGNYVTGFYLIPRFTVDAIVAGDGGGSGRRGRLLGALALTGSVRAD